MRTNRKLCALVWLRVGSLVLYILLGVFCAYAILNQVLFWTLPTHPSIGTGKVYVIRLYNSIGYKDVFSTHSLQIIYSVIQGVVFSVLGLAIPVAFCLRVWLRARVKP